MTKSLDLKAIEALYRKYETDLKRVREEQIQFYRTSGYLPSRLASWGERFKSYSYRVKSYLTRGALLKPQLDDLEAEITYLRVREANPATVVEISPCGGWSSTWILQALRDNGKGELHSYDLVDTSTHNVPKNLAAGRWHFHQGDVTKNPESLPARIDYLFIDSDHSAQFAKWYIDQLFPRVASGTPTSVHDVFHTSDPTGFDSEGGVIVRWLEEKNTPYFTASSARSPESYQKIQSIKANLGLNRRIHHSDYNSMIFFNR